MKLCERVKLLRLDQHLTQKEFGERLGVSRAVIVNLEHGVLVNANSINPLVKLMAKEFSVSEEWLRNGVTSSPEYIPHAGNDIQKYLKEQGVGFLERAVISRYLENDHIGREVFASTAERYISEATEIARGII